MIKREWIPIMKQRRKLKLKFTDLLNHYLIVLFLLIPLLFSLFSFFQKYVLDSYTGVRQPGEMLIVTAPFGLLAIFFLFIQKNRLRFKTIETDMPKEKIKMIIKQTAQELEWHPEMVNDDIVVAKTHPNWWEGSWGEQITILLDNHRILINSICDPNKPSSVVSFGRNRNNIKKLITKINNASS